MVDMWEQFLEYVQHKGVPMSDGEWCSEALAFSGGNTIVACALLDMVHKSKVIEQI